MEPTGSVEWSSCPRPGHRRRPPRWSATRSLVISTLRETFPDIVVGLSDHQSGIAPIAFLIEYAIGIRVDARTNSIAWTIRSPQRIGIERLWFAGRTVSLVAEPEGDDGKRRIYARGDGAFRLTVSWQREQRTIEVAAGTYYENVMLFKSVNLIGANRTNTIIDASGGQY